jgi:pimeloyl-ACP methyl ester carboxylesterase
MALTHDVTGRGDPLVLIHGLATTRSIWRLVAPLMALNRQVVLFDVPGFGDCRPAGPGFELPAVADAVRDGLRAAGVREPYDIAGHSMGATVAAQLAARDPDAVRSLVLVSPVGLRPMSSVTASVLGALAIVNVPLRRAAAPIAATALGRRILMAGRVVDARAMSAAEVRTTVGASCGATRTRAALEVILTADQRELLRELRVPVGAVWAAHDRLIPAGGAEMLAGLRPDAVSEVVARAGHLAMVERPAEFAEALERVLLALTADRMPQAV